LSSFCKIPEKGIGYNGKGMEAGLETETYRGG